MNEAHATRKPGADKIALLGLFVLALLTARLIVASKSALVLSEPIELTHTGLSVSMPMGNGWRSEKQWEYRENAFILGSAFAPSPGRPTAWAYCQYYLAAETATPEVRFEQKAFEIDGVIAKTDQTRTDTLGPRFAKEPQNGGPLTVDWAYIKKPDTPLSMFLGTVRLSNNRQLDIQVHAITGDADLAEQAFKRIVESLSFRDNQLLKAGAEIIAKIKNKGLDSFLDNQSQQALFLLKDSRMRTIGFTMDVLVDYGSDAQSNIRAAGLFYVTGRYALEQVTSFQSGSNLDEFVWKSETHSRAGRSGTEMILNEAGVMAVRKFGAQPEERDPILQEYRKMGNQKNYHLSPAALPDVFLEQLLGQMLEDNKKEIIVDIIDADGKIIPTLISRSEAQKDITPGEEVAHVLKLELLDGRGFSQHVYLNDQEQIYKALVQQEDVYIFESATIEEVVKKFPERAEYILQKNRTLR